MEWFVFSILLLGLAVIVVAAVAAREQTRARAWEEYFRRSTDVEMDEGLPDLFEELADELEDMETRKGSSPRYE